MRLGHRDDSCILQDLNLSVLRVFLSQDSEQTCIFLQDPEQSVGVCDFGLGNPLDDGDGLLVFDEEHKHGEVVVLVDLEEVLAVDQVLLQLVFGHHHQSVLLLYQMEGYLIFSHCMHGHVDLGLVVRVRDYQ
jgi:hypothetical protein